MNKVLFSHNSDEWSTPDYLFKKLDDIFLFSLDPCSSDSNFKCDKHYTINDDGLKKSWYNERVFVNPPYSNIEAWARKCFYESQFNNAFCVMLIPARTDTKYFHTYLLPFCDFIFIKGRVKFSGKGSAPFPSMICIFKHLDDEHFNIPKIMNYPFEFD